MYVHFESLSEKHFSLIFEWFNLPHVQKFYSLRSWIYEEIALKMRPYITGEKKVSAFIVYIDDIYPNNLKLPFLADDFWSLFEAKISKVKQLSVEIFGIQNHLKSHVQKLVFPNHLGIAVALVQKCKILDHPWPDMELSDEIMSTAAGIDFFIGPSAFLRKGLGSKIIHQFLSQEIWPFFDYCIVDPDVRNVASCKFFNKLGFMTHKIIQTKDALGGDVELNLMILKRG